MYTLAMLGGLHLSVLILLDTYTSYAKVQLLTNVGPYLLLLGDALFNRVYMPLGQMFWYMFYAYGLVAVHKVYMAPGFQSTIPLPEVAIFNIDSALLAYTLPLITVAGNYLGMRLKFALLGEGDVEGAPSWSISAALDKIKSSA